jgi:hypothetical protein
VWKGYRDREKYFRKYLLDQVFFNANNSFDHGDSTIQFRGFFYLTLFVIGILLAAGCSTSTPVPVSPRENASIPATTEPVTTGIPVQTATPVRCLPVNNTSFISIDPIPVHHLGDTITFRGTTNLEPGELITIRISEGVVMCAKCRERTDSVIGCCGDFNRTVVIREGFCGNNLWSLDVNTSNYDFRGDDDYWIGTSGRPYGVGNSSFFTISGIPRSNLTLNLPANDSGGSALRFSGRSNTGNGPDEKLFLTVSSDSGREASFIVPVCVNGTGYFWNFTVNKSVIVPYNFLTVKVSSQTSPEIRIERTFMYTNEPAYYPYNPNGP